MKKSNPINLAQEDRKSYVQGKFEEAQDAVLRSGLTVHEITQIIEALKQSVGSIKIGEKPKEEAKN